MVRDDVMGAYKYITQTFQDQYKKRAEEFRTKMVQWRREGAIVKVEKPTNLSRARTLGYKAKQGYIIVRVRVDKGRRTKRRSDGGRKHKNYHLFIQPQISHQNTAEQRANRKYKNLEVLNSYWIGEDGNYTYYEIILADASKPTVNISSVSRQGKTFRGLTSSGNSRAMKRKTMNKTRRRDVRQAKPYKAPLYKKTKSKSSLNTPLKETKKTGGVDKSAAKK